MSNKRDLYVATIHLSEGFIVHYLVYGALLNKILLMLLQDGDYAFVLGIQIDIGDKFMSASKLKLIDDLFNFIPNTVNTS